MREARFLVAALVATLLSPVWAGAARSAEAVRTRAAEHPGYGRMVFDWASPVEYRIDSSETLLSIRFERPLTSSFEEIEGRLGGFVRSVALSEDDSAVEIIMTAPHRVRAFTNESSVVVDMLRTDAAPRPPAGPAPLAVRTGKHDHFGRFVFDWAGRVGYEVERSGDTVTIQFDRPAKVDVAKLWRILPPQVSAVSAENARPGLKVELAVPADTRTRHFRDGDRVVIDVIAVVKEPKRGPAADPRQARRTESPPAPGSKAAERKDEDPFPTVPASAPVSETARPSVPENGPGQGKPPQPTSAGPLVSVDVVPSDTGLAVRFNWRREVGAAVFRRQRTTWIVFDKPGRLDLGGIRVAGRRVIDQAEQAPANGLTALALRGMSLVPAQMRREGSIWILDLARASEAPPTRNAGSMRVENDAQGLSRLVFSGRSLRAPQPFLDPEIGDQIWVASALEPGDGASGPRQYVDVEVFASFQGVALRPNSETVEVRPERDSIVVTSRPGLKMSNARGAASAPTKRSVRRPLTDLREWRVSPKADFEPDRSRLFDRVIQSNTRDRNDARAELARFYMSHGMPADAIGVIDLIAATSQEFDADMRSLRGAANYLLGHYADATADFDHPDLRDEAGVLPWRAAVAAAGGDWREAYDLSRASELVLAGYPHELAFRLGSVLAEAALTVDELDVARKRLAALRALVTSPEEEHQVGLLQGYLFKKAGMVDQALAVWREVSESENRFARARAVFAETTTLLETKKIDGKAAAEKLERLNFTWRGDAFEFDVLRQLGEIYIQNGEPREALSRLRLAATYFDNVKGTQVVAGRMSEVYRNLYLGNDADKLAPLTALAMFDEYRELLPSGRDGEEMVRRLADRLVRVDLLSDAAALLESQIDLNLTGVEKARVGARLAAIQLLDRKPMPALAALNASEVPDTPTEILSERKLLQARAYADLGKAREAIAVIDGESGRLAEDLRLAIQWRAAMWRGVAATYAGRHKNTDPETLDADGALDILRWSIGSALADDTAELERLRSRFGTQMAKSKHAEAFRVVVGSRAEMPADYKTLAKQAGDIGAFNAFLAKYREQPRATAVSQVN